MPTYNDVDAAIRATAARAGMSPAEWKAIASIESSLSPQSNIDRGTQYKGLFQIGTRDRPGEPSEWTRRGRGDVYNAMDNATAAADLAAENNAGFQKAFGRAPTPIETYMMHQQGLGFFTKGALTNVEGNLPPEDRTPENMTHNGLLAYYSAKMARLANKFRDPNDPNEISYSYAGPSYSASSGGGGSGGAAAKQGATAPSEGQGDGQQPEQGDDYASQMAAVRDKIAQQEQANQPQPLPPMQMPEVQTPGMLRAKQLAQAMLNLQMQKAGVAAPTIGSPDGSTS